MTRARDDIMAHIRVSPTDDTELRESLKHGWHEHLPGIKDENGRTLIGNRRERLARELRVTPNFVVVSGLDEEAKVRLAAVSNVGGEKMTKEDRKHLATILYTEKQWTQQKIAKVLSVSQQTIALDLRDITNISNVSRTDTRGRRASPGRPRQARPRPTETRAREAVRPAVREGRPIRSRQIAEEIGASHVIVEQAAAIERAVMEDRAQRPAVEITPDMLPTSARERLERAVAQATARLEREYELKVETEVRRRIEEVVIPHWTAKEEEYNTVIRARRGVMTAAVFRKMLAALHEDLVQGDHNKRRARECFTFLNENKVAFVAEAEHPTRGTPLPRTMAEWDEARRQATEHRRAQRAARRNGSTVST